MAAEWVAPETFSVSHNITLLCTRDKSQPNITFNDEFRFYASFGPNVQNWGNGNDRIEGHLEIFHEEHSPFASLAVTQPVKLVGHEDKKFGRDAVTLEITIEKPNGALFPLPTVVMCGPDCPCKIDLSGSQARPYHVVKEFCSVDWIFDRTDGVTELTPLKSQPYCVGFMRAKLDVKMVAFGGSLPPCPNSSVSGQSGIVMLREKMKKTLDDQFAADVKLMTDGVEFSVNSFILSANSDVFAAMLQSDLREGKEKVIEINELSSDAMDAFVKFLYYRDLEAMAKNPDIATLLLNIGNKYNVADLKAAAEQVILTTNPHKFSIWAALYGFYYGELLELPNVVRQCVKALKLKGPEIQESEVFKEFALTNGKVVPKLVTLLLS